MPEQNINTPEANVENPNPQAPAADPVEKSAEKTPSIQDLLVEVAKLKRERDRAAKESAEWKKQFRATQSEQEIANAEKAEAQAKRDEEFEAMKKELQINKLEKAYMGMGYTADEAGRIAVAEAEDDFTAKMRIMAEVDARKMKEHEAEWLKTRPLVNAGTGNGKTYTQEQFDKMGPVERTKLYRENRAEYDRLMGR